MVPDLDAAAAGELRSAQTLERCEQALAAWQQSWDTHAQAVALGQRETGVERARIEQLDGQQRRLLLQQEKLEGERASLAQMQPAIALEALEARASSARDAGENAAAELQELLAEISATREREQFLEESETRLFEKVQQQQEKETELEQREEDLRTRSKEFRDKVAAIDPQAAAAFKDEPAKKVDEFPNLLA